MASPVNYTYYHHLSVPAARPIFQTFGTFAVVLPGFGIVHQVNLEHLARGVHYDAPNNVYYPDTLVGTDSHTTMINGICVVGWGVGGIEAEAGMLGQPV